MTLVKWFNKPELFAGKSAAVLLETEKVGDLLRFFVVPERQVEDQYLLSKREQVDFNRVRFALRWAAIYNGFTHIEDFSAGNFSYRDGYFPNYHLHVRLRCYRPEYNPRINPDADPTTRPPDATFGDRTFTDWTNGSAPATDRSSENRPLTREQQWAIHGAFARSLERAYRNHDQLCELANDFAAQSHSMCDALKFYNRSTGDLL